MFKQLFASMNDALDDIITQWPEASGKRRAELEERLSVLKAMSDTCIEEWLLFEEKLGKLSDPLGETSSSVEDSLAMASTLASLASPSETASFAPAPPGAEPVPKDATEASFARGQGYYKLHMFRDAVAEFEAVVKRNPDLLLARIYLAMSYLRCGEYADAYRHFQFLLPLTEDGKMKAISYNAMGYIQAEKMNLDKAMEYYQLARSADPASSEPELDASLWAPRS